MYLEETFGRFDAYEITRYQSSNEASESEVNLVVRIFFYHRAH